MHVKAGWPRQHLCTNRKQKKERAEGKGIEPKAKK
jgi:hypothetical protein